MAYLEIRAVVPGPRLVLDGVDPSTGRPARTTIHSGYVALERSTAFRGAVRADDTEPVAFFVPDAPPYAAPPATLGLELSVRRFRSLPEPGVVTVGPADDRVELAPDPRGGEHRWLQVVFRTPIYGHRAVEIAYRLTVQEAG